MSQINSKDDSNFTQGFQPLPITYKVRENDVLCGRGIICLNHPGNALFKQIVKANLERYMMAETKKCKSQIIQEVIAFIRSNDHGGGFIKQDIATGRFYEVSEYHAREKTSQAFREMLGFNQTSRKKRELAVEGPGNTTSSSTAPTTSRCQSFYQTEKKTKIIDLSAEDEICNESSCFLTCHDEQPMSTSSVALDGTFSISGDQSLYHLSRDNHMESIRHEKKFKQSKFPNQPLIPITRTGKLKEDIDTNIDQYSRQGIYDVDSVPIHLFSNEDSIMERTFVETEAYPHSFNAAVHPQPCRNSLVQRESSAVVHETSHVCRLQSTSPISAFQVQQKPSHDRVESPLFDGDNIVPFKFMSSDLDDATQNYQQSHQQIHPQTQQKLQQQSYQQTNQTSNQQYTDEYKEVENKNTSFNPLLEPTCSLSTGTMNSRNDVTNDDSLLIDKLFEVVYGYSYKSVNNLSSEDPMRKL